METNRYTLRGRILPWVATLSPLQVIEKSKRGISGNELTKIQEETNFSNEDWSRFLQVAWRTIQRYREHNTRIDSASSERALLMAQLAERGKDVFGDDSRFKMWLDSPSFALGGAPPMELLDTTTGMRMVSAELTRIEHGVY